MRNDGHRDQFLRGLAQRCHALRKDTGLDVEEYARRVSASVDRIKRLENGDYDGPESLFGTLQRMADLAGIPLDQVLFSDTTIGGARIGKLRHECFGFIRKLDLTQSIVVVERVFEIIENEHDAAQGEQQVPGRSFRDAQRVFQMTEERARELVKKAEKVDGDPRLFGVSDE